jgi:hypothetical protein
MRAAADRFDIVPRLNAEGDGTTFHAHDFGRRGSVQILSHI